MEELGVGMSEWIETAGEQATLQRGIDITNVPDAINPGVKSSFDLFFKRLRINK